MRHFPVLLTLLLLGHGFALAANLRAADIRVDNVRGDDRRDGDSGRALGVGAGPLRSITRALEIAQSGDRILLTKNEVPYRESITLQGGRHSGSPIYPFEIDGQGATLDGTAEVPGSAWHYVERDIFYFEPLIRTTGLLLDGDQRVPGPFGPDRQIWRSLEAGHGVLADGRVWFRIENGRLPQEHDLRWPVHTVGITLYEVRDVVIQNLNVQGFALDGINLHDGARDVRLGRLTLRANGRSGLHVGGACRAEVRRSQLLENGRAQLHLEGACRVQLAYCDLPEESAPAILREGGQIR